MGIKLRQKKLKSGRLSLYMDICWNGQRRKEYLGIFLERPVDVLVQEENALKMQVAQLCCEKYAAGLQLSDNRETHAELTAEIFLNTYADFILSYKRSDVKVVKAVAKHLIHFVEMTRSWKSPLDKDFCENFLLYLFGCLHGNTPVGYFKKIKMCLAACVEKGLLKKSPAEGIRLATSEEITKDILDSEEIQMLANTPISHAEVKRAFLFACYTGLRWCDVVELKYKAVDFKRNMLVFCQRKVKFSSSKAVVHLNLNRTAVNLLRMNTGLPDDRVFSLPSYSYARRLLINWAIRAGIQKHITFHCARHSFITNIMLGGANIKTASLLAGHSTIRHTEKYVHIIDEVKQKAVDNLPDLELVLNVSRE